MEKRSKTILKYVIDIVIIIIGVLAAFYLTNWGNAIQKKQTEQDVIAQIYFELQDNLSDLKNDMVIHETALNSHIRVQEWLDDKRPYTDSLIFDFYWLTREEYIFANTSGYENLKTFGINLIEDEELRNLITLVYNYSFPRLQRGQTLHPDITEFLWPYYEAHFSTNRDTSLHFTLTLPDSIQVTYPRNIGRSILQYIGYVPLEVELLQRDPTYEMLLSEAFDYRLYKVYFYRKCIANVEQALAKMEEEYELGEG
ncbi:MAG: hypothetical protein AAF798_08690 [Bacteroidota bacterium]